MRNQLVAGAFVTLLACAAVSRANGPADSNLRPPTRPLPFTAAQVTSLQSFAAIAPNADLVNLRASYSPEAERTVVEWGVLGSQTVVPLAIIITLIAAAPL